MNLFLGIDPGRSGALAVLDRETGRVDVCDMPDTTAALHDFIAGLPIIRVAALERPFVGPKMSARTLAVMFENYGVLRGALEWRDIPYAEVPPHKWKAALGLSKDKAASREKANRLFPDDAGQWPLVKHDGRAEAALLAWWGSQL